MMMPAEACWLITSQAPTASTPDWIIMRSDLETAPSPPDTSLDLRWLDM